MRIAAAAYSVDFFRSWNDYASKLTHWVAEAAAAGADVLVFPEYAAMELTSLFEPAVRQSLVRQLAALQTLVPDYIALHQRLAREYGVVIVAGSIPVAVAAQRYHNRVHVFSATGTHAFQDKIQMTRFENEKWGISGARELNVIDVGAVRIGIAVCYDVEFPDLAHAQVVAGADLILAPSCTDTRAGYERVRLGCRARALENQCYVVQSSLVGTAEWSPAIDVNVGAAGVYAPVDYGFPDDGIVREGVYNEAGWIVQDVEPAALADVRRGGQVFNFRDWDGQRGVPARVVEL